MGKGGGGGGGTPTQTTAYQTNLPEYAQPYVMSMLGAAQNQLFNTSGTGAGAEITGFKPYTPYSTDPTKYFAGPSSLQQGVYREAEQMQTPSTYAPAMGIAGVAGMGQLGAGQQYARQVTDPRAVQSYMSPYQQAVTDVAKMNAVREAQIAGQQANLGAARQGTYGGARQALAAAEREKNLLANLSNIQAQGSQAAYDKAMQNMQFGSNLGLQGLAGASSTAGTLAGIGGQQQQSDLARMGFQQQTGAAQQQYQQNIINQAIQDYATAQQYPYMQLSTMSNLLRGLPMQGMTTQQYQAQPSTTQQLLGLAGTGASLYGAFGKRAGGEIKEYKAGGAVGLGYANRGVVDSMRDKLEEMADTNPQGLKKLIAQSSSKELKEMGNEILSGIARANTGDLGRNMAGGGIIAFNGEDGSYVDPLMQFSGLTDEGLTDDELRRRAIFEEAKKNDYQKAQRMLALEKEAINRGARVLNPLDPSTSKNAGLVPPTKAGLEAGPPRSAMPGSEAPPSGAPATAATEYSSPSGLAAVLAERKKLLGFDGPGEKNEALMKALEERQAGMGKEAESDRYLRMAEAFSRFGSTAGPIGKAASEALGGFAKGEATARKEQDKMKLEGMRMQSDLEKARRAEARGDLDSAEKFYNSAEDRKNRIETANISAAASMYSADREQRMVEQAMADPAYLETLRSIKGYDSRLDLVGATAKILESKYPDYKLVAMIPEAKRTKEQKEYLANAYKDAESEARRLKLAPKTEGKDGAKGAPSGKVDTTNPLLKS